MAISPRVRRRLLWTSLSVVVCLTASVVVAVQAGWFSPGGPTDEATAVVGPDGVDFTHDGVRVVGPAGVAPPGTELTVTSGTLLAPERLRALTATPSAAVGIELSGRQPQRPLKVTLPLRGSPPVGTHAVLITQPSGGAPPHLVPGRYDAASATVTATVEHLSWFWPAFLDLGALGREVERAVTETTGISGARPDCAGQPADAPGGSKLVADADFSPQARPPLWACLKVEDGGLVVDLVSNSPLPWRVRAAPGATLDPQGAVAPDTGFLLAAYHTLVTERPYAEGLLVPGAAMTYRFPPGALPVTVSARADVGTWLVMDLMFAVKLVMALFKIDLEPVADSVEVVSCLGAAAESAAVGDKPDASAIASLAKAVLSCLDPFVKALGGTLSGIAVMVLAVLANGAALVFGGLQGIVLTLTGEDTFTFTITSDRPADTAVDPAAYRFTGSDIDDWERYYFTSPSGRFVCGILGPVTDEPASAGCHGTTQPIPPRPSNCSPEISWGSGMFVDAKGNANFICTGGVIYDNGFGTPNRTLPYGSTLTALGFICSSAENGVRCLHTATGHGFRIASASNEMF